MSVQLACLYIVLWTFSHLILSPIKYLGPRYINSQITKHSIGKTMTVSGWGIDQQTSETDFSVATILYKAMVLGYTSSDCCVVGFFSIYLAFKYI